MNYDLQISPSIMSQLCRTENRYLTKDEIHQIADFIKEMAFSRECAALYFWLMGPHDEAQGICYEVCLTTYEAFRVDQACEWIGIPC